MSKRRSTKQLTQYNTVQNNTITNCSLRDNQKIESELNIAILAQVGFIAGLLSWNALHCTCVCVPHLFAWCFGSVFSRGHFGGTSTVSPFSPDSPGRVPLGSEGRWAKKEGRKEGRERWERKIIELHHLTQTLHHTFTVSELKYLSLSASFFNSPTFYVWNGFKG